MSQIQIDPLIIHQDDLGDTVGFFHETAIKSWNPQDSLVREARDLTKRLAIARLAKEGPNGVPA